MKGLYKKFREGLLPTFNSDDDPYQIPSNPDINIRTGEKSVEEWVEDILHYLTINNVIENKATDDFIVKKSELLFKMYEDFPLIKVDNKLIEFLYNLPEVLTPKLMDSVDDNPINDSLSEEINKIENYLNVIDNIPINCQLTNKQVFGLIDENTIVLREENSDELVAVINNPTFYLKQTNTIFNHSQQDEWKVNNNTDDRWDFEDYLITGNITVINKTLKAHNVNLKNKKILKKDRFLRKSTMDEDECSDSLTDLMSSQ